MSAARKLEEPSKTETKRVIPVLNNDLGKRVISAGGNKNGHFDGGKMLVLNVGTNLVPEEVWAAAASQESVQLAMKSKIKRIGAPEDAHARVGRPHIEVGPALNADNPLLDLDDEEQLTFVSNTESLDLLKSLATQQAPGQVLIAINDKIRKIEDPKHKPRSTKRTDED